MTRHVRLWKEKEVKEIAGLAKSYPVIAIADITNFPAALFQDIRKKLKGRAVLKVSKVRVAEKALKQAKPVLAKFSEKAKGSVVLIFSSLSPFELSLFLRKNKGSVGAKIGMVSSSEIIIPKGDTGLPPGPALSDLKTVGLNVRIQGSTIFIMEDKIVCKKGEVITKSAVNVLSKLGVKPIKVGLNLIAAFENGEILDSVALDIDPERTIEQLKLAHAQAFNLAFNITFPAREVLPFLIQKAYLESEALSRILKFENENSKEVK